MTTTESIRHINWSVADKLATVIVLVALISTALWMTFTTSFFIKDISLTVQGSFVRYVRETPHGNVTAEWQTEITLIDGDGFTCMSGPRQPTVYQEIRGNAVTYNLGVWADDCLTAGPPYYMTVTKRALLFGVIPLRQSVQTVEVRGERDPDLGYMMQEPASNQEL
jgi:hypothetical protein